LKLPPIKISHPATGGFWEISVLFEDEHLLALDKPAGLALAADLAHPELPALVPLLHAAIAAAKPWATARQLDFLDHLHHVDAEASGALLFAKNQTAFTHLANQFSAEHVRHTHLVLVHGTPGETTFFEDGKIAPHPVRPNEFHLDPLRGKKSRTDFTVLEKFQNHTLLRAEPAFARPHQLRVHLERAGWPVVADELYGGQKLWLSRLKSDFRLKRDREERPLLAAPAVHSAELAVSHPVTAAPLTLTAPTPKHFTVALKFLRQYAS
jgi:RluA family pseudouridine synthase